MRPGCTDATALTRCGERSPLTASLVHGLFVPLILSPGIVVMLRRLHDTDRSGWWLRIQLVPAVGVVLPVFILLDGSPGGNRYAAWPRDLTA